MEFTELREQGVWGEATHTREMSVCARFLKSGMKDIQRKVDTVVISFEFVSKF